MPGPGRPQVRITELLLETGSGVLRGNLALRLVQPPPADAAIPPLYWLSAIEGEAHVTIAEPLLTLLATSGTRATPVAGYEAQKQAHPFGQGAGRSRRETGSHPALLTGNAGRAAPPRG